MSQKVTVTLLHLLLVISLCRIGVCTESSVSLANTNSVKLNCQINREVFTHHSFCLNNCITRSLQNENIEEPPTEEIGTIDEFERHCLSITQYSHQTQPQAAHFNSKIKALNLNTLFNNEAQTSSNTFLNNQTDIDPSVPNKYLHVFIFDFRSYKGEIYIDLKQLDVDRLRSNLSSSSYTETVDGSSDLRKNLVLNFVSTEFVTFRLLNVPKKSEFIWTLTILLSGDSSLNLIQPHKLDNDRISIDVHNAPLYSSPGWPHFLRESLKLNLDSFSYTYVQHLSVLCRASHLRFDLTQMVLANFETAQLIGSDRTGPSHLEYMELIDLSLNGNINFLTECLVESNSQVGTESDNFEENPIFLFEIEHDEHESPDNRENYLRMLVQECDVHKKYTIILNVDQRSLAAKKLIFDDYSKCKFDIYVS